KYQRQRIPRNALTDLVYGSVAKDAELHPGTAKGETGQLTVRVYRPRDASAERLPLVVNFHGGGWTIGSLDETDWLCSRVAVDTRAVVVSVEYRLAPDHRFPAAAEDCYA